MKYVSYVLFTFILTLPFNLLLYHQWTFVNWLNSCLWESLILLMIGGLLFVLRGEFFNAFIHAFKKFFILSNKKEQLIAELEQTTHEKHQWTKRIYPSYTGWFVSGATLFIFSLIFSVALQ